MTLDIDDPQIRLFQGLFDLFNEPTELALVPILFPASSFNSKRSNTRPKRQDSTAILITASRMASGVAVVCSEFAIFFSLFYSENILYRHFITAPNSSSISNKSGVER